MISTSNNLERTFVVIFALLTFVASQAHADSIALAGDSTVTDSLGWGGKLDDFLPSSFVITNKATSGRSTKSFINEGRWTTTVNLDSDYVFIQFGHNDQKLNDPARGTYPIDNPPGVTPGALDQPPIFPMTAPPNTSLKKQIPSSNVCSGSYG